MRLDLAKLRSRIYYRRELHVVVKSLQGDAVREGPRLRPPATARLSVCEASAHDVQRFAQAVGSPARARKLRRYLDLRYRCFLAYEEGQPVGQFWWVDGLARPGHPAARRLRIALCERDVYGFDFFVVPSRRGGGIATEFLAKVERELARRGYRALTGDVDGRALPALWLYQSTGYEVARTVRCRELLRVLVVYGRRPTLSPSPVDAWRILVALARTRRTDGGAS